jgi:hypothetical protein
MGQAAGARSHDHEQWEAFARQAAEQGARRQVRLLKKYGLVSGAQYLWSLDDASIMWGSRGGCFPAWSHHTDRECALRNAELALVLGQ